MELRHLRYFVAVAEELHFGRAARRLHIAQPPLSRQIRDLEREIGAPLFERVPRGAELTAAGRAFLPEARLTLAQAERAQRSAQRAARGEVGRIRVGFVETATYSGVLPEVLGFFRLHLADVGLSLFELTSLQQADAFRDARIDVGLLHSLPPDHERTLGVMPLLADPLVVAVPPSHRLAARTRRGRLALADLKDESFVLFPRAENPPLYDAVIARCRAAGFSPRVVQEAVGWTTPAGLVAAGVGLALVPRSFSGLRRPDVVFGAVRDLSVDLMMLAAWRRGDRNPARERFVTVLKTVTRVRPTKRRA